MRKYSVQLWYDWPASAGCNMQVHMPAVTLQQETNESTLACDAEAALSASGAAADGAKASISATVLHSPV